MHQEARRNDITESFVYNALLSSDLFCNTSQLVAVSTLAISAISTIFLRVKTLGSFRRDTY